MEVRIRKSEERVDEGRSCGEMNPEQLHHLVDNLNRVGIYTKETNELLEAPVEVIYRLDYNSFYAEIIINTT